MGRYISTRLITLHKHALPIFHITSTYRASPAVHRWADGAATGDSYKKIPRELTLMLQEALLRDAVKFGYEPTLGSDAAVAILDHPNIVSVYAFEVEDDTPYIVMEYVPDALDRQIRSERLSPRRRRVCIVVDQFRN